MEFKLSFVQCIISSKVHLLCYHSIVNIIPRASQPTYAVLRAGPTPPIQMPLPSPPIQNSSLFPISSDFLPTIHPQTIRFQHPTLPQVLLLQYINPNNHCILGDARCPFAATAINSSSSTLSRQSANIKFPSSKRILLRPCAEDEPCSDSHICRPLSLGPRLLTVYPHPTGPQKNRNCYLLPCLTLFFLHLTAAAGNNICSAGLNADSSTNMFSQPQSNERRRYP